MRLAGQGLYTFLVDKDANKGSIAQAVENKFDVSVISVKIISYKDEVKQQRRIRHAYTIRGSKKALVRLKPGQKIKIFEAEESPTPPEAKKATKEKKSLLKGTKVKIERTDEKGEK